MAGRAITGGVSRAGLSSLSVPSKVTSRFFPCPAGKLDLGSLHALQAGQVWVRFILCRQIRSGFAPYLTGRSDQSVAGSQVLRALEVLKLVCLTRGYLVSGQGSVWPVEPSQARSGLVRVSRSPTTPGSKGRFPVASTNGGSRP